MSTKKSQFGPGTVGLQQKPKMTQLVRKQVKTIHLVCVCSSNPSDQQNAKESLLLNPQRLKESVSVKAHKIRASASRHLAIYNSDGKSKHGAGFFNESQIGPKLH